MNEIFNDPDEFAHFLMIKCVKFLVTLQAMDSKGACFETLFPKTAAQLFSGRYNPTGLRYNLTGLKRFSVQLELAKDGTT